MKPSKCIYILNFSAAATAAIVYITDMPEFAPLAPCARSGIVRAIQMLTFNVCPAGPTPLQSCVCTKDDNSSLLRNSVSQSVQRQCSTGTENVNSAGALYNQYCNQVGGGSSPATTTNPGGTAGAVSPPTSAPGAPTSVADPEKKSASSPTQTTTSTPSSTPSSTPTTIRSIPLGPIIGGSIGFVVLLIALLLIYRYFHNRPPSHPTNPSIIQQTPHPPIFTSQPSLHTYKSEYTNTQNITNIHHIHTPSPPPPHPVGSPFSQQQQHGMETGYNNRPPMASTNSASILEMNSHQQYQSPQRQQQQLPTSNSNWTSRPNQTSNPTSRTDYEVEEM